MKWLYGMANSMDLFEQAPGADERQGSLGLVVDSLEFNQTNQGSLCV